METDLHIQPAAHPRKQIRQMLRKSSWLVEQARLLVLQSQSDLDPTNSFARNLADVQRHLVATSQGFHKTKSNADRGNHDTTGSEAGI